MTPDIVNPDSVRRESSDVQSRHGKDGWSAVPYVVMVDERGYWWRVFGEGDNLSMVPTTSDNKPVKAAAYYRLVPFGPGSADGAR